MRHRLLATIGAASLALTTLGLAACSSPTVDEASTGYCDRLDSLGAELATMRELVASDGSVDDLAAQRDVVREAYLAAQEAGDTLGSAVSDAADTAAATFEDALDAIPGDASLSEAAAAYATAADAYVAELASIGSEAGCS